MRTDYNIGDNINGLIILEEIDTDLKTGIRNYRFLCTFCKNESKCSAVFLGFIKSGKKKGCKKCDARLLYPTKICRTCKVEKNSSNFEYRGRHKGKDLLMNECRQCYLKFHRQRSSRNIEKTRNANLFRSFGITLETFNKLFESQGNVCAICKTNNSGYRFWCVDHCHITGRIRGILCSTCNSGLGLFKDKLNILKGAVNYLDKLRCPLCDDPDCQSWRGHCINTNRDRQDLLDRELNILRNQGFLK